MPAHKRNYAFIDANNLILGVRKLGWDIDYAKFRTYLLDKYRIEKAYWFLGYISYNKMPFNNYFQYINILSEKIAHKKTGETLTGDAPL